MTQASLEHTPDFIASFDGTMLAVRSLGTGEDPILLVPSVGASIAPWRPALRRLVPEHPVVTWDLRGLHTSGPPATQRLGAPAHAEDAIAVLDHLGLDRVPVVAWSTGGRAALELAATHPDRVSALVLICGMNGYPLTRLFRHLDLAVALPRLAGIAKPFSGLLGRALQTVSARPEVGGLVRQGGFLAPGSDIPAFVGMLREISECDTRLLLATYEAVAGDPKPEILDDVIARTYLVLGGRDPFTPRGLSEEMLARIPGSVSVTYERAGHFLPLEFPGRLAADINTFLAAPGLN